MFYYIHNIVYYISACFINVWVGSICHIQPLVAHELKIDLLLSDDLHKA